VCIREPADNGDCVRPSASQPRQARRPRRETHHLLGHASRGQSPTMHQPHIDDHPHSQAMTSTTFPLPRTILMPSISSLTPIALSSVVAPSLHLVDLQMVTHTWRPPPIFPPPAPCLRPPAPTSSLPHAALIYFFSFYLELFCPVWNGASPL
jgi:hypothetical protein